MRGLSFAGNKISFLLLSLILIGSLCGGCKQAPAEVLENQHTKI